MRPPRRWGRRWPAAGPTPPGRTCPAPLHWSTAAWRSSIPRAAPSPWSAASGETFVITYNGELYNAPELRSELETRGWRFPTHSDTEVLLRRVHPMGARLPRTPQRHLRFRHLERGGEDPVLARDRLASSRSSTPTSATASSLARSPRRCWPTRVRPAVDAEGLAEIFALGPARTPGHGVYRGCAR